VEHLKGRKGLGRLPGRRTAAVIKSWRERGCETTILEGKRSSVHDKSKEDDPGASNEEKILSGCGKSTPY